MGFYRGRYLFTLCLLFVINDAQTDEGFEKGKYDFIIVGAGSAGSILANRLSAHATVLLLEKGPGPSLLTEIPALAPAMTYSKNADRLLAEKQSNLGSGLQEGRLTYIRGKGLGGTSLVNYLIATRGHRLDYDKWASLGNPGWGFDDVLPYFKKFENAHLEYFNETTRSEGGEFDITNLSYKTKAIDEIIKACMEIGMPFNKDYNSGNPWGVSYLQANIRKGKRCHTEKAFLEPVKNRKSLEILKGALVTRVLIDKKTKTAIGVEYKKNYLTYKAYANKEVILAASAIYSPQILMLSGIGPKEHLEEMNIEVIQDLPVGKRMYDHVTFIATLFKFNETIGSPFFPLINPLNYAKVLIEGTGPLSVAGYIVEGLGFIKTEACNETGTLPCIELILASGSLNTDLGLFLSQMFNVNAESFRRIWNPLLFKSTWTILPFIYHPDSVGYLKLKSNNPEEPPLMYANFYTDPKGKDLAKMLSAVRIIQKIANTPQLKRYGSFQQLAPAPGCEHFEADTDDFWKCQIKALASSLWHQVATCKMGPKSDPSAVVDSKLKVHGIKNLRVVDTSIIPIPISAHTNVPAIMVGEKGASIILKDHGLTTNSR